MSEATVDCTQPAIVANETRGKRDDFKSPIKALLGRVGGSDEDEAQSKRDEGAVVHVSLLAA